MNSSFLYDCRNLQNCFMCWNLRDKQYCIKNVQYSKDEYENKLKEFDLASYSVRTELKKQFWELVRSEAIHRQNLNVNTANSSGNFLENCRNCRNCYFLENSENCVHFLRGFGSKDVLFGTGTMAESSVFSMMDGYGYGTIVTERCSHCRDSAYLDYCEECTNCFGCVGLRKKQYCILNKQYSKEEYGRLRNEIEAKMRAEGSWGKFFPKDMAYGGYNFSVGRFYFPMAKSEAEREGFLWEETADAAYEGLDGNKVPDRPSEAGEDFWQTAIICSETKMRFNISPEELAFHKRFGIPLPHEHPDHRTLERCRLISVCQPFAGECFFCKRAIEHFYPEEWGYRKIACMDCYNSQVA